MIYNFKDLNVHPGRDCQAAPYRAPLVTYFYGTEKINKHFMMKPGELLFLWAGDYVGSYFTEEVGVDGLIEFCKCSENCRDKNIVGGVLL